MAVKPCTGTIHHIHKKIKQISGANGSRKNKPSASGNTSKACDHHGMPVNEIDFEGRTKNPGKTATEARLELSKYMDTEDRIVGTMYTTFPDGT